MLFGDIALVDLALALGTQESRIDENEAANGGAETARGHGRGHASHRVAEQDGSRKPEPLDQCSDIGGVIRVAVSVGRRAGIAVAPGVRHDDVVFTFKNTRQRNPAGSAGGQTME